MFTREEYENLINNSPLFEIDKESSPALYKSERYNFLTLLTDYYRLYIYPNKSLDSYGMTLMETAIECIKYYDKNKGPFLHLFNSLLKRDLRVAKGKELIEEKRQGIKISKEDDKLLRKIITYVTYNTEVSIEEFFKNSDIQKKVATNLVLTYERLKQLLIVNNTSTTISNYIHSDGKDEFIDLFKGVIAESVGLTIEKSFERKKNEEASFSIESRCENISSVKNIISSIQQAYDSVQERQKVALSMLLTVEIIEDLDYDLTYIEEVLKGISFRSQRVMNYFIKYRKTPTARQIAARLGVSENSLSRTYKNFKLKIRINNE